MQHRHRLRVGAVAALALSVAGCTSLERTSATDPQAAPESHLKVTLSEARSLMADYGLTCSGTAESQVVQGVTVRQLTCSGDEGDLFLAVAEDGTPLPPQSRQVPELLRVAAGENWLIVEHAQDPSEAVDRIAEDWGLQILDGAVLKADGAGA